jgi:hypothetical protein
LIKPKLEGSADPHAHLISLIVPGCEGSIPSTKETAERFVDVVRTLPEDVARVMCEASDIWCGLWRFAVSAANPDSDPLGDDELANAVVDDVLSTSMFDMTGFSQAEPSGMERTHYATCAWDEDQASIPSVLGDADEVAYAIDHSIAMLSIAGMIVMPKTAWELRRMRLDVVRHVHERSGYDQEIASEEGLDFEIGDVEIRNMAIERLMRSDGLRDETADLARIGEISQALGLDLDGWKGWLGTMADIHEACDPETWSEMRRRKVSIESVHRAAQLFLSIDRSNIHDFGSEGPIRERMAAAAYTSACAAILRSDPMETMQHHPSATLVASGWGAKAAAAGNKDGIVRNHLTALVHRHAAWNALTHSTRDLGDLPYLVSAVLETLCRDVDGRADAETHWLHYGIPAIVARYSQGPADKNDLAWIDFVMDAGIEGSMARNQDPTSTEAIMEMSKNGKEVRAGQVLLSKAVVHCVDPDRDADTLQGVRSVLDGSKGIAPGRAAFDRMVDLDGAKMTVPEAASLAEELMEACEVHGCYVVGTMDGRPFAAMAAAGTQTRSCVGADGGTRH